MAYNERLQIGLPKGHKLNRRPQVNLQSNRIVRSHFFPRTPQHRVPRLHSLARLEPRIHLNFEDSARELLFAEPNEKLHRLIGYPVLPKGDEEK